MLTLYFSVFFGVLPLTCFFANIWKFFISNNYFYYRVKPSSFDKINKTSFFKKLKYSTFVKWNLIILCAFFICIHSFRNESFSFFWNHLAVNNFKFWCYFTLFFLSGCGYFFVKVISNSNSPQSIDFYFSISNLTAFIPLIYYSNTLFTFLFVMEVISALLFYKFVTSKVWFRTPGSASLIKDNKFVKLIPRQYLNVLFFQFWSNFFSTILIFMSLLIFFLILGSTEWFWLQVVYLISNEVGYSDNNNYFVIILFPLLVGIFFKLGLSPLHLYKIEVYKGLPFITIFFYTTYFFFSLLSFFVYLLVALLGVFSVYWVYFLSALFIVGSVVLTWLLFDVQYIKAFFAYSTVVNVILIFLVVVVYLNN